MDVLLFLTSLMIIGFAELGDKTQLLTISLASKYPMEKVIFGIISATAVLALIAVGLGGMIQKLIPALFISILSGAFFIIYGLMIIAPIREENEKTEKDVRSKDAFWIVFASFFFAEIGDKTQLATMALTAKYGHPFSIWMGAAFGMIIANLFGIVIGNILKNYLPEKIINYIAGALFILFGFATFLSLVFKI